MNDIDFSRSFVRFTSTRVNHTPRLQIDAACTLVGPGSKPARQYFLSCACIGEEMYQPANLIHDPVMEVLFVIKPDDHFLMIKRFADATRDTRDTQRLNESMPTQSGTPSKVTELGVHVERYAKMRQITTYSEFRAALLGNQPIHARTSYTDEGGTQVVMDYPTKTVNVAHGRESWHVDAGPILIPSEPQKGDLEATRFNVAYIVFYTFDRADVATRQPTASGERGRVTFYAAPRSMTCRNELVAVE